MHDNHYPAPYGAPQRPRRPSWRLWLALAVIAGVVAGVVTLADALRSAVDPVARARQEAAFYADQERAARLQWVDDLAYSGLRLLPLLLLAGAGVVAWRRYGWRESIGAHYTVEATRAQRQLFPAGLKSLSYHYSPKGGERQEAPALLPAADADDDTTAPQFGELLDRGAVGRGQPLTLGYVDGKPLAGSWLDLYSTATAGLPGAGKTTTQRFLAAQSAMHGARFIVIDKHADAADDSLAATLAPLAEVFLCEPASTERAIIDAVKLAADEGGRRLRQRGQFPPVIVWVDEATALLGHSKIGPELAALLEQIAQQFRKRQVFANISGQIWTAERSGGSALRDSLASVMCHRMKRSQARLLVPTDEAALVERLAPGRALLWRTTGASEIVTIPNTTGADVRRVAGLLTGDAASLEIATSAGTSMPTSAGTSPEAPGTWSGSGAEVGAEVLPPEVLPRLSYATNPRAARVRQLLREQATQNEILSAVWGASGGRAYQQALAEYREIVAALVGGEP